MLQAGSSQPFPHWCTSKHRHFPLGNVLEHGRDTEGAMYNQINANENILSPPELHPVPPERLEKVICSEGSWGLSVHGRGWVRPCSGEVLPCPLYPHPHSVWQPWHTAGSPPGLPERLQVPPGRNGFLTPAPPCTTLNSKGKAYLAGTQGHPQTWSGGCWRHHRTEQSGLLSQKNLCLSTLRLRTQKKALATPGICSNSRQLKITQF